MQLADFSLEGLSRIVTMRTTPTLEERYPMEAFSAGTLAGAGSFSCDGCGFAIALHELDEVPKCPECGGRVEQTISAPATT